VILPNLVTATFMLFKQSLLRKPRRRKAKHWDVLFLDPIKSKLCFYQFFFSEVVTSECKHTSHCAPVLAETSDSRG